MTNPTELKVDFAKLILTIAATQPKEALIMINDLIKENKELKQKIQELHETLIRREG